MAECASESFRRRQRLHDALLGHLQASKATSWPGVDGLTVSDVLRHYPQAMDAGQVPGREILQRMYPELADELDQFFGNRHPESPERNSP